MATLQSTDVQGTLTVDNALTASAIQTQSLSVTGGSPFLRDDVKLPSGSSPSVWWKANVELVTNIGSGRAGATFMLVGTTNFGNTLTGVDIIEFNTRGSGTPLILTLVTAGARTHQYGYVNNSSSGRTEFWIRRFNFPHDTTCYLLGFDNSNISKGDVLSFSSQGSAPSGIVYIN